MADTKNLLKILFPVIQDMPKIERIEGAPVEMKRTAANIIYHFSIAKECEEVRLEHIHKMIGNFGVLQAMFEICLPLITDSNKLAIAKQLERIEEGVRKWRIATRQLKSREQRKVTPQGAEVAVSNE